jgi:glutamate-1-semialdehyde 2,1-aminomutase
MKSIDDLHDAYTDKNPRSAELSMAAEAAMAGGVAHDGRATAPFPLFVEAARGAKKWTADGHELIDYWMGHGALMLGHGHPDVTAAVTAQVDKGTHYGASHEAEVRWAHKIIEMVPSAELVRFVASRTEATHLALRLARAATGRSRICRFEGHFHGWHDWVVLGNRAPFDRPSSAGISPAVCNEITVLANNDADGLHEVLSGRDVAAVILEPGGGTQGRIPLSPVFLRDVRSLTEQHGTVLIFDEVVTGFRVAPGGVQERSGVTPDLTTLAKIVAGGLPGGAVCGRREIMDMLSLTPPAGVIRVAHPGTFNANPLSATAGVAMLDAVADGSVLDAAALSAAALREGINRLLLESRLPGWAYGERSIVHLLLGPAGRKARETDGDVTRLLPTELLAADPIVSRTFRTACLFHGLDLMGPTMMVSSVHEPTEIAESLARFERAFTTLAGLDECQAMMDA